MSSGLCILLLLELLTRKFENPKSLSELTEYDKHATVKDVYNR